MKCKYFYFIGFVFFFSALMQVRALAQGPLDKKISIEVRNADIKSVLKTIEKLADVRFAYSSENIDSTLVSLTANNQAISNVLRQVLITQNITFEDVGGLIVLHKIYEVPGHIHGAVTDENGLPLPGVTIRVKGTAQATSTDANGIFSINLQNPNAALIFSYIAYATQEVGTAGRNSISIKMVPYPKVLSEVVVVGYGTQKKIVLTGAVSTISTDDIQQTPSASIQNSLTGKVTGFFSQQRGGRPGDDGADFYIRGVSTFNGTGSSQQPLILVDDIEYTYPDFSNIDPNEVQSISILKDASTTAPYGVKGANGVVLVTTRRGQTGKARINLRTEFGLQVPMHVPQFLDAANTATLRNEALKNDALISGSPYVPEFTDADIALFRSGADPYGHPNVDWYHTLFKGSAPIRKSNADVSGGSDNVQYFISLGFENQGGILRDIRSTDELDNNYNFDRFNFRANVDIKATNSLSFRADFSGNTTATNSPKFYGQSGSAETAAFYEVFNYESLNPYTYPIHNPNGSYGFANPNRPQPAANNIIGRIALGGYQLVRANLFTFNASATQKLDAITSGLKAKLQVNVTNGTSSLRSLTRVNFPSYYYDPVTGTYTPRDATIYRIDPYSVIYGGGQPNRQSTLQGSVSYDHSFHTNKVSALLLYNQNTKLRPITTGTATELANTYIPETLRGLTGRLNFNHNNKYLAEFDGSYNGSNKFAASKQYGFFPAGSAGYVISEEEFIKQHLTFINLFKFRASYGIVGSDNLGNYANYYLETYGRGGSYLFGTTGTPTSSIIPGTFGNSDVTWEKERKLDIGIDFSMFNGRLGGSADLFRNKRYDILTALQTVPHYYGVPIGLLPPENLGIVANNGYEFELTYTGRMGKVGYNLKGNYSYAKNKILEIDEVPQKYGYKTQTGRSIGEVPEYIWDGFYSTAEAANPAIPKYIGSTTAAGGPGTTIPGFLKYRDMNGDGVITDDDKGYFGHANLPTTILSLNTGFTFKRFALNILLQSALNYDVQIGYPFVTPFKGNLQQIHLDRWTPETAATAQFPALISNFQGSYMSSGNTSTFWAISGNYLRLKSVELSYNLPDKLVNKIGLKGLRIYANAYNLHTWSGVYNRFGLDPEVARGGSSNDYQGVYPQSAIVNLGLSVTVK
ncbi:TonB-dependent receptor [Mucilaginibacter mali]|uniref:TonB-dependent receptor n=1 Tax=Mucilaginibacter mali TaxID=2740462 RepID=A0A7D4TT15_9SPHI|nr:TonB-dependent receptor [Mucilaginibacter mali]QKJ28775.1 TonB-dependent receptor [Mucilaginibacter mali]